MSTLPSFLFLIFLLGAGILLIQQVVFWGLIGAQRLRSHMAVRRFDRRWEWERLNCAQQEVDDFLSGEELSRTIMVRCQPELTVMVAKAPMPFVLYRSMDWTGPGNPPGLVETWIPKRALTPERVSMVACLHHSEGVRCWWCKEASKPIPPEGRTLRVKLFRIRYWVVYSGFAVVAADDAEAANVQLEAIDSADLVKMAVQQCEGCEVVTVDIEELAGPKSLEE